MDPLPIALALLVAIATTSGAAMLARRRGMRLRTAVFNARAQLEREAGRALEEGRRVEALALAEAEAGWAAQMANRKGRELEFEVERLRLASARLGRDAAQAESRVDELTAALRSLAEDGSRLEARAESAENRLVEMETEMAATLESLADTRAQARRATAILSEAVSADEHRSAVERAAELEERLLQLETTGGGEVSRLASEVTRLQSLLQEQATLAESLRGEADRLDREVRLVRDEADRRVEAVRLELGSSPPASELLMARQAEITDLQERLAQLTAVRNAEATRLGERIASLERLYVEVDIRESRINELEQELKATVEALEATSAQKEPLASRLEELSAELSTARAEAAQTAGLRQELEQAKRRISEVAAEPSLDRLRAEMRQLRALLAAERERNARLVRRATVVGSEASDRSGDRIAALRRQVADLEARLQGDTTVASDEVTRIKGIGPKIAAILADHGIHSVEQISRLTAEEIARIAPLLPVYPGRIVDDGWVEQARRLVEAWKRHT